MKKIVWLDIGTHFGQEFNAAFGSSSWFGWKVFRRFCGATFFRKGQSVSARSIFGLMKYRRILRQSRENLHVTFVEANRFLVGRKIYQVANDAFNLALGDVHEECVQIGRLYSTNNDKTSQGNTIYDQKQTVDDKVYISCPIVKAEIFIKQYKHYIEQFYDNYEIVLRINCEGSEDEIIYAMRNIFGDKFNLILGSLKDVRVIKGEAVYADLLKYMAENNLEFYEFHSSPHSWDLPLSRLALLAQ